MFSRLDTLIIRVRDIAAAQRWYTETLDLDVVYADEDEKLAVLGLEGTSLTLWQLKDGEEVPQGAGAFPIFAVDDARAAHEGLLAKGVTVEPLQSGTGVRYFDFFDPDGNRLEACQVLTA